MGLLPGWWARGIPSNEPCTEDEMSKIAELEAKVDGLIAVVVQLRADNAALTAQVSAGVTDAELQPLIEKIDAVTAPA